MHTYMRTYPLFPNRQMKKTLVVNLRTSERIRSCGRIAVEVESAAEEHTTEQDVIYVHVMPV